MKILIGSPADATRATFLTKENIAMLESIGDVTWNEKRRPFTEEELREEIAGKDVIVTGGGTPPITACVMENADRLKLIAHYGGSVKNHVSDAAYEKGVRVVCGNDAFAHSVAEGTIAYMLASLRRIPHFDREVHRNGWGELDYFNESLSYKTVGLIGYGDVSRHLVNMLKPFLTEVLIYSSHLTEEQARELGVEKVSLEELLRRSHVVSLHCANRPENHHMINKETLAMMRDGALIVNTSGTVVIDEEALYQECKTGRLRAAIDVHETEAELPLQSKLRWLEDALLIPHHAGPTIDRRQTAAKIIIEDILNFKNGLPLEHEISRSRRTTMSG